MESIVEEGPLDRLESLRDLVKNRPSVALGTPGRNATPIRIARELGLGETIAAKSSGMAALIPCCDPTAALRESADDVQSVTIGEDPVLRTTRPSEGQTFLPS